MADLGVPVVGAVVGLQCFIQLECQGCECAPNNITQSGEQLLSQSQLSQRNLTLLNVQTYSVFSAQALWRLRAECIWRTTGREEKQMGKPACAQGHLQQAATAAYACPQPVGHRRCYRWLRMTGQLAGCLIWGLTLPIAHHHKLVGRKSAEDRKMTLPSSMSQEGGTHSQLNVLGTACGWFPMSTKLAHSLGGGGQWYLLLHGKGHGELRLLNLQADDSS